MSNTALLILGSSLAAIIHSGIIYLVARTSFRYGFGKGAKAAAKDIQRQIYEAAAAQKAKQASSSE